MDNKETRSAHVQEFVGKYEETNPISKKLVSGFYGALESLIPVDAKSILEAGCGAGISSAYITKMPQIASGKTTYEASDVSEELIALAQEALPETHFSVESIYSLERADNSFDLVMALETLEHLEEPEKALAEIARASKKYVLMSVPREPLWCTLNLARFKYITSFGNTPGHINHWSKRSFVSFVEQKASVIETRSPIPWTMVLAEVRK